MKKKFACIFAVAVALSGVIAGCLSGCDGFGTAWKSVSTYEELVAGYSWNSTDGYGYSVKLKNDIDCEFATISPLLLGKTFDGNGYTIKNAVVKPDNGYASFFKGNDCIKNVTLENITVQGGGRCDAIVASSGCSEISNVHIKNSKLTITQTIRDGRFACFAGGIYGGITDVTTDGKASCVISDCTVKDTEITLNEYKGDKINQADIYMGGIAGCCAEISGCRVENCTLFAESSGLYCTPFVGGVVGAISGNVSNTCSVNNTVTAEAMYYSKNVMSQYSTSVVYCGGIAARVSPVAVDNFAEANAGRVNYCYADNNEITAKSTGDIYVGGLFGFITKSGVNQCYSKSNKIVMDGYKSGNKSDGVKRRCGGIAGSSTNNSITSCFVYNDNGLLEYTFPSFNSNSKVAGIVAGINNNLVVSKCASFNGEEKLNAPTKDEFCPSSVESVSDCFVSSEQFGNVCGCEVLAENFWDSPNSIKSKLGLLSGYWKFDKGIPYLDFSE